MGPVVCFRFESLRGSCHAFSWPSFLDSWFRLDLYLLELVDSQFSVAVGAERESGRVVGVCW